MELLPVAQALLAAGADPKASSADFQISCLSLAAKRYFSRAPFPLFLLLNLKYNSRLVVSRGHMDIVTLLLPLFTYEEAPSALYDLLQSWISLINMGTMVAEQETKEQRLIALISIFLQQDIAWLEPSSSSSSSLSDEKPSSSCLHLAASSGQPLLLKALLECGGSFLLHSVSASEGATPIQLAETGLAQSLGPDLLG